GRFDNWRCELVDVCSDSFGLLEQVECVCRGWIAAQGANRDDVGQVIRSFEAIIASSGQEDHGAVWLMFREASRCLIFKEMEHGLAAQRAEPILDQPHEPAILENWAKPLLPAVVRAIMLAHSLDELPAFVQERTNEQNSVDLLTMTGRCFLGALRDCCRDRSIGVGP